MYLHYSILLVYRGIISVESFQTTRGSAQSPTWFWILYTVNQCPFSCNYVAVNCKHVFYLNSTVQTLKSTAELTPLILSHYPYTGSVSSVEEAGAELTPSRSKSRLSLSDISPSRVSFLPRFLRSSFSRLLHREKEGLLQHISANIYLAHVTPLPQKIGVMPVFKVRHAFAPKCCL